MGSKNRMNSLLLNWQHHLSLNIWNQDLLVTWFNVINLSAWTLNVNWMCLSILGPVNVSWGTNYGRNATNRSRAAWNGTSYTNECSNAATEKNWSWSDAQPSKCLLYCCKAIVCIVQNMSVRFRNQQGLARTAVILMSEHSSPEIPLAIGNIIEWSLVTLTAKSNMKVLHCNAINLCYRSKWWKMTTMHSKTHHTSQAQEEELLHWLPATLLYRMMVGGHLFIILWYMNQFVVNAADVS